MSGIVIDIIAGANKELSQVEFHGETVRIITDADRASFGIGSDKELKKKVEDLTKKSIYKVFLCSPALEDQIDKASEWSEVQVVLKPMKSEILGVALKPTIVATKSLRNGSKAPATFSTKMSHTLSNTVSHQWTPGNTVNIGQSINYKIFFVEGATNVGYTRNWGKNGTDTTQTAQASETSVTLELKSGQSETVELRAFLGTMNLKVTYEAYLRGQASIYANHPNQGHTYEGLDIEKILGGPKRVEVIENIMIGFYCKETAELKSA